MSEMKTTFRVVSETQIQMRILYVGSFNELFEVNAFPFDTQVLSIILKCKVNDMKLIPSHDHVPKLDRRIQLPDWKVVRANPFSPGVVQVGTSYKEDEYAAVG